MAIPKADSATSKKYTVVVMMPTVITNGSGSKLEVRAKVKKLSLAPIDMSKKLITEVVTSKRLISAR